MEISSQPRPWTYVKLFAAERGRVDFESATPGKVHMLHWRAPYRSVFGQ